MQLTFFCTYSNAANAIKDDFPREKKRFMSPLPPYLILKMKYLGILFERSCGAACAWQSEVTQV